MRYVKSDAEFSPCKQYRYSLTRIWDRSLTGILYVGLNPSTADGTKDDPTIRRLVSFTKDQGYGGFVIINLFAYRTHDPSELFLQKDPIGLENNFHTKFYAKNAGKIVAMWGSHGNLGNRDSQVLKGLLHGKEIYCFGINKDGTPKHPLYLPHYTKFIPFKSPKN